MTNEKNPLTNETVAYEPAGPTGNAYWIMGATAKALRRCGHGDKVTEYQSRATSGNYQKLLAVTREYVNLVEV